MSQQAAIKALASEAAGVGGSMHMYLVISTLSSRTPAEIREDLAQVFSKWPVLCRLMAELEEMAPKSAGDGYDQRAEFEVKLEAFRARQAETNPTKENADG